MPWLQPSPHRRLGIGSNGAWPRQQAHQQAQGEDHADSEVGERRDDLELAQIVEPINGDGNGLGATGVEQDGALSSPNAGMKTSRKATKRPGRDSGRRMRRIAVSQLAPVM